MIRGNKLYINITNHCDVCCPFCCMKSDSKKQSFMNFDTIHKIMKDMDGQYIVQLEGGEPTTHPQFYLLMEYISTLEKVEEIVIDTNALTLDRHNLKENKVYLNDIWKCIDKDNRFTPIKQLLGYYYYVEVYKYQNIDMVSESANLVKLYEQKQIANDVVFEMIFHPNGNLNGSWVDDEDILLAYNPYKS